MTDEAAVTLGVQGLQALQKSGDSLAGIACGYAVISGILQALARRPEAVPAPPATAVIVTGASSH